jgi:TolA-binding protein
LLKFYHNADHAFKKKRAETIKIQGNTSPWRGYQIFCGNAGKAELLQGVDVYLYGVYNDAVDTLRGYIEKY